jgi:hypothetical protein
MEAEQTGIQLQTLGSRRISRTYSATLNESSISPSRPKSQEYGVQQEDNNGLTGSPEELATLALPPVDRGLQAWSFVAAAFALETLVWGFGFT